MASHDPYAPPPGPSTTPGYGPANPWQQGPGAPGQGIPGPTTRPPLTGAAKAAIALTIAYVALGWLGSIVGQIILRSMLSSGRYATYSAYSLVSTGLMWALAIAGLITGLVAMRAPGRSRTAGALAVGACGASLALSVVSFATNALSQAFM